MVKFPTIFLENSPNTLIILLHYLVKCTNCYYCTDNATLLNAVPKDILYAWLPDTPLNDAADSVVHLVGFGAVLTGAMNSGVAQGCRDAGISVCIPQQETFDFKFGTQLGFAKAHHKITHRRKAGHGPGLVELPKIWGSPFNIYTMAEASDFKFGTQLRFAHHKITPIEKSGHGLGIGKLPYIWGSPLILLQRPRCPLSVSGASCFF